MRLAVIEWVDAWGSNTWTDREQLEERPGIPVTSVGWMLKFNKVGAWLVATVNKHDGAVASSFFVPKGMITKITYLKGHQVE